MHFSAPNFSWIQIVVVSLALCNSAHSQLSNLLQQGANLVQQAPEQPQFPIEQFTGPGSSVESEATKPFNTVATNPTQVATDTAAAATTTTQETTTPTKIENQIQTPTETPTLLPDQKLPANGQESTEKLPNPLPANGDLSSDAELNRLIQLLKAILSTPQIMMGGSLPLGPPPFAFGQPQGGPLGEDFGPSPFMGPRPPRFPGGRRIARIIIMRRPRGAGGMPMDGNFMGNNN